jgi:hypothetical protein
MDMSYDIYGETLRRGHCEVHPWVHCEYPCPVCMEDISKQKDPREQDYEKYCAGEYDEYCRRGWADYQYELFTMA